MCVYVCTSWVCVCIYLCIYVHHGFPWLSHAIRLYHVVYLYSRIDMTAAWRKLRFILSDRFDFNMTDTLLVAVHAFTSHTLMSFSVDETLLQRLVNLSTSFREPSFSMEMSPFLLKRMYSVLSALTWRLMPPAACSRLCSQDLAWVGVFARSPISST